VKKQIKLEKARGRKLTGICGGRTQPLLLVFDDEVFVHITIEDPGDDCSPSIAIDGKLEPLPMGNTLVNVGILTLEELDVLKRKRDEWFQKQRDERDLQQYERLKAKFEAARRLSKP